MKVKPTRSELMKLKKKIKLARSGHKLLKKKRDGLILEFFEIFKKVRSVRKDMVKKYKEAKEKIALARISDGDLAIKSAAMAILDKPEITVNSKNIMGLVVPNVLSNEITKQLGERGYGTLTTSAAINESAQAYEELIEYILLVAEVETSVRRLLVEIEKTKRRVNALEFDVIPRMQATRDFIQFRLEELERETIYRSKRIKKKRQE